MPSVEAVCYRLPSISWESLSVDHRRWLEGAVGTSAESLADFCECLFDRYVLLHNMGHVVFEVFHTGPSSSAQVEHLANLFAVKYLQNKSDLLCLDHLDGVINRLLDRYGARFDFDLSTMDRLYASSTKDLMTLAVFQFNSFRQCLGDPRKLGEVLAEMAGRDDVQLNPFVFPRRGAKGNQLVNECAQLVFELNTDYFPRLEVTYPSTLSLESLAVGF